MKPRVLFLTKRAVFTLQTRVVVRESGNAMTLLAPDRANSTLVDTTVSVTPNNAVATLAMGLTAPVRSSALICTSATNAATMMMLISAKSLRSSRYVKMGRLFYENP